MPFLLLFALFVLLPITEIVVMIEAAQEFGILSVVLATIFTAVLGTAIIRWQGLGALNALREQTREGKSPAGPMIHAGFLVVAAPLLMTPGFITDSFGFLLLVPPVRVFIGRRILTWFRGMADRGHIRIL